jgi:Uma2 family endonuclease
MALALLREPPLSPPEDLGPYRAADYFALPDEPRCELIFGRISVTPSPFYPHQAILVALTVRFDGPSRRAGGKVVVAPMDVTLADHTVVQPDLIYLSPDRRSFLQDRINGAPDLLVEILSPGTARRDRGEKLELYARSDVREYWIVDPAEKHIEFLINEGGRFVVTPPERGAIRSRALPGLELPLVEFWTEIAERLK